MSSTSRTRWRAPARTTAWRWTSWPICRRPVALPHGHEVVRISEAEVGEDLLVDFGLVDAAVQRPQQTVYGRDAYEDIHAKAAALFQSLARNHAFVDGNKRVAVAANGWVLRPPDQGELVALAVDTADAHLTVEAIADTLKGWAEPLPVPDDD